MKVVISGSFRKYMDGIIELKEKLESDGIEVLKPSNILVIDNEENPEFIKFVGEDNVSEEVLEAQYIEAIYNCDAHIIYNKDSYIGSSAIAELCLGCGNNSFTKREVCKGIFTDFKINSQVYLLENIDYEKTDSASRFIRAMIEVGNIKVGLAQMYKDFDIVKRQKVK